MVKQGERSFLRQSIDRKLNPVTEVYAKNSEEQQEIINMPPIISRQLFTLPSGIIKVSSYLQTAEKAKVT